MEVKFKRKYDRILEILEAVAECAGENLILVGGTALSIFYLKHRVSIDLDFVPFSGDDIKLKEALKACLSKKGYHTMRAAHGNQFVVNFDDTAIKIEIFEPEVKVGFVEHKVGNVSLRVAPIEDLLKMKEISYADRKAAKDLYDMVFILKSMSAGYGKVEEMIEKYGLPADMGEMEKMAEQENYQFFERVVKDASKAGN